MMLPSKEEVERIRKDYPPGTMVVLEHMDDVQSPPVGTIGEVTGVDDVGSLLMRWQNGSGLNVVFPDDRVRKLQ